MVLLKFVVVSGVSALGNRGEGNYCKFFQAKKKFEMFFTINFEASV